MARTLANIKKRFYRVLNRVPAAFTQPADAAGFATFLGTFAELGICEDKTISLKADENESLNIDTGAKHYIDELASAGFTLLQSEPADYAAVEAINKVDQDYLLYAENEKVCIFIGNAPFFFKEAVTSGDVEKIEAVFEKIVSGRAAFRTRFVEPVA